MDRNPTDRVKEHVDEIKQAYEQGKQSVRDMTQAAADTSKEAITVTDEWVRGHSWQLLALTFGIGLSIGLLLHRRPTESRPERVPQ